MSVRTVPDLGRWIAAMRRPGIDPRINIAVGEVLDVGFDPDHGMFAEVKCQPDMNEETCAVGSDCAGSGFGEWNPLKKGDIVYVGIPMGNPGYGPVLFARIWSAAGPPPPEFGDESTEEPTDASPDRTIVVEPGRKYRIVARDGAKVGIEMSGGGDFEVTAKDDSNITLTAEKRITVNAPQVILGDGGKQVATVGDLVAVSVPAMANGAGPVIPVNPLFVTTTGGILATGKIMSGRAKVKA